MYQSYFTLMLSILVWPFFSLPANSTESYQELQSVFDEDKRSTIADNRLEHTNSFPDPGFGYDQANNYVFSNCLQSRYTTPPTFDFKVVKSLVDKELLGRIRVNRGAANLKILSFLADISKDDTEAGANNRYTFLVWMLAEKITSGVEQELVLLKRYQKLLSQGKIAHFYSSCGTQLIQSVTTYASYQLAIRFEAKDNADANNFALMLKSYIRAFDSTPGTQLERNLVKRKASLFIEAIGISSTPIQQSKINLVPEDLIELKKNITELDEALSTPNYGKISTISIASWSSIPSFLDSVKSDVLDTLLTGRNRSHHRKNSEQVALLSSTFQAELNFKDLILSCAREVEEDFLEYPQGALVENHLYPGDRQRAIPLAQMPEILNQELLDQMENQLTEMELTRLSCYEKLDENLFHNISYQDVEACNKSIQFEDRTLKKIGYYCPIRIVK